MKPARNRIRQHQTQRWLRSGRGEMVVESEKVDEGPGLRTKTECRRKAGVRGEPGRR